MITRRRLSFSRLFALSPMAVFVLQTVSPGLASAQEDTAAAETAAARALAIDGLKLAQAGQCEEAIDKLDRAEKLRHSPIVLSWLGECHVNLGRLVEGTEILRRMLREPLPPEPTPALEQAYQRAQTVLRDAKPNIAAMTISVDKTQDATPTLLIDGKEMPATVIGVELPADPGEHIVEVSAPGFLKASARVKLARGEKQIVSLELRRDPNAPLKEASSTASPEALGPTPTPGAGAGTLNTDPPAQSGGSNALAYVSYGIGAVGLGVGIGFGLAAMSAKSGLEDDCPGNVCDPGDQDRIDSAKTKGTVSTIGFAVGAAGLAVGTVLLFTTGDEEAVPGGTAKQGPGLRARARVGLGSVQLSGEF